MGIKGLVLKSTGSWYLVEIENGEIVNCRLPGKHKLIDTKTTNPIAVGDEVRLNGVQDAIIEEILPRKNFIERIAPKKRSDRNILASNIDQAIILVSISKPRTANGFIDRFLFNTAIQNIPTTIIFNKRDALTQKEQLKLEELQNIYEQASYNTILISALYKENIDAVKSLIKNKKTLLGGYSGAGKSTLINVLIPNIDKKTNAISVKTGKGMHTTTYTEMHKLPFGGYIIDAPGIKEFGITETNKHQIHNGFIEMHKYIGKCKFNDCLHVNEPACAILEAVAENKISDSRYKSYLSILNDLDSISKY